MNAAMTYDNKDCIDDQEPSCTAIAVSGMKPGGFPGFLRYEGGAETCGVSPHHPGSPSQ